MSSSHSPRQGKSDALVLPGAPADATAAAAATHYHRHVLLTGVYYRVLAHSIEEMFPSRELRESCLAFVADTIKRADPRDPMEEMLVGQMLLAHLRSLHMTFMSGGAHDIQNLGVSAQHAERASNTYRRLMLALAEYRRPVHRSFTAIVQANVAQQQIVANGNAAERGCRPPDPMRTVPQPRFRNNTQQRGCPMEEAELANSNLAGTNKDDRVKRAYTLSPEGLASLRAAARRNRPWEQSTGPRTAGGGRAAG